MANKTSYFKIGAFTLASLALIIGFVILLGMGNLFKSYELAETYFNESVQGLDVGSPVKYRGVTIGKVKKIALVSEEYAEGTAFSQEKGRYIYVQFSLSPELRRIETKGQHIDAIIQKYVKNGLRASLATQDLVGNVFLSLNFIDTSTSAPLLPIGWKPQYIYIPSTPSTLAQLTDTISTIAVRLNKLDFEEIVNNFNTTMQQINLLTTKTNNIINSQQKIGESTLANLHQMSINLTLLSSTLKNNPSAALFGQPVKPVDPSK